MPEMWLSLCTRSILSHLQLTHLEAICKCSSICRTWKGEKRFFLSTPKDAWRGVLSPDHAGPRTQHPFQVQCSKTTTEREMDRGTGMTKDKCRALAITKERDLGSSWGSAPAWSPHRPDGASLGLILDESPGSPALRPLTPFLGPIREEEGNILFDDCFDTSLMQPILGIWKGQKKCEWRSCLSLVASRAAQPCRSPV